MAMDENLHLDFILRSFCEKIQLSREQHAMAESRYVSVGKWLADSSSPLAPFRPQVYPQGSMSIGTTTKPVGRMEFDIDLICELGISAQSNPVAVLDGIEARLRQDESYRRMLDRPKKRCVRLNYAGEFHLDIVPSRPDPAKQPPCILVPDRELQEWWPSNPKGFTAWFLSRAEFRKVLAKRVAPLPDYEHVDELPSLKRVVQLLKRWRDIAFADCRGLAPVSVVLTTLAAHNYGGDQSVSQSLLRILNGIVESLPANDVPLDVPNPTNPDEPLSEKWRENPEAYRLFASRIRRFRNDWQIICCLTGIDNLAPQLEALFEEPGHHLMKGAIHEYSEPMIRARQSGTLGIHRSTGLLTTATMPTVSRIPRNTFHGE